MPEAQPLILITCDDGIESPGLRAAARAVLHLGDVIITATCEQQSGSGRSLPNSHDGAIHEIDYRVDDYEVTAFAIHGSPAQSVLYALLELVPRKPALCVSGINFGENVGSWVTSSGTVGAALEAANAGVPSLAVSLETDKQYHYRHSETVDLSTAAHFAHHFASRMLTEALPFDVDLLKVDIPSNATAETPWRLTRLSRQRYFQPLPSGRRYLSEKRRLDYEIAVDHSTLEPDSDVYALFVDRVVTVTPLSLDLTSRTSFETLDLVLR